MAKSPVWGGNSIRIGAPTSPAWGGNSIRIATPQPPQAAPVAPAFPPPTAAAPPPEPPRTFVPDSIYNDKIGLADRNFTNTNSDLNTQEANTKYDFGFDDPRNPFGKAQESKRNFLMKGQGLSNSFAARGQFYSGIHQSMLDENQHNADKDNASLRAAYNAALDAIRRARDQAVTTKDTEGINALTDAFTRQGVTS